MKISYKWLREYVDTDLTPNELDELLTFSGLEIEGVEKVESIKGELEQVVIAQVLTCEPHPDSDHRGRGHRHTAAYRLRRTQCGRRSEGGMRPDWH